MVVQNWRPVAYAAGFAVTAIGSLLHFNSRRTQCLGSY